MAEAWGQIVRGPDRGEVDRRPWDPFGWEAEPLPIEVEIRVVKSSRRMFVSQALERVLRDIMGTPEKRVELRRIITEGITERLRASAHEALRDTPFPVKHGMTKGFEPFLRPRGRITLRGEELDLKVDG